MAHPISVENAAASAHFRHSRSAATRLSMSGHTALGQVRDIQTRHHELYDWRGGVGRDGAVEKYFSAKKVSFSAHFANMYVL